MRSVFGKSVRKRILALAVSGMMMGSTVLTVSGSSMTEEEPGSARQPAGVEEIAASMTLDDKISQMIMPAVRTWDEKAMTFLPDAPKMAEALRAHQYGGIILFSQNVADPGQVAVLVHQLQENNLKNTETAVHIPYFMAADEEGGIVVRLAGGTRMTGNMAVGATGDNAVLNAEKTGQILGEEMAAAGFNVNFAPDIDVNNNPANPVIGTRSFSDDPDTVADLGVAYAEGVSSCGVIPTYKHFPGHGDTSVDSHTGTPSVEKTYDQIRQTELKPFAAAIDHGADMIMTAHITFPVIDDEKTFGDGTTKGVYPATMSEKILTQILRRDMGFDGVVVTDALEMDAIRTAGLVPGEPDSAEYRINIAKQVILAGADILLIPTDLNSEEAADFYDTYIEALEEMALNDAVLAARIDESVMRILKLKEKYGILEEKEDTDPEKAAKHALQVVGSGSHHKTEMEIARQAVTLLKNDRTLPAAGENQNIVFLGRQKEDAYTIGFAVRQLMERGLISKDTRIVDLALEAEDGPDDAGTVITIDYYYDLQSEENKLHYTEDLQKALKEADIVIGLTKTYNVDALAASSEQYQGIARAIEDTHAAGGRFVLLSDNLPYDAARYQDADAIVLAYMGSGLDLDPTQRTEKSGNMGSYNANVVAAIDLMFGDGTFSGTLPVQIPEITEREDGSAAYSGQVLYERGFGLQ